MPQQKKAAPPKKVGHILGGWQFFMSKYGSFIVYSKV